MSIVLRVLGFSVVPLHGDLSQSQRSGALAKFRSGERTILVATDVASRYVVPFVLPLAHNVSTVVSTFLLLTL